MNHYTRISLSLLLLSSCHPGDSTPQAPQSSPSSSSAEGNEEDAVWTEDSRWLLPGSEPSFSFTPLSEDEDECSFFVKRGYGQVNVPSFSPDGRRVTRMSRPHGGINVSQITELVFPEGFRGYDYSAFYGYQNLLRIRFPESVEFSGPLIGCPNLTEVYLPESYTNVCDEFLRRCGNVRTVHLSSKTESIGSSAFEDCAKLLRIDLPDTLQSVGSLAFRGCASLTSVELPKSLTEVYTATFARCTSLVDVQLSEGIQKLGTQAFFGCTRLSQVFLPSSVQEISSECFMDCSKDLTLYCETKERPEGWAEDFCGDSPVKIVWGAKRSDVPSYH